jgi:AraC-like DNA-binding protein
LTDRPGGASAVDPLSELLDTLRLAAVGHDRHERVAPWAVALPDDDVARVVVVARGAARLEGDGARPRALSAGDVVLLAHGGAPRLCDAGDGARRSGAAVIVVCAFRFRAAHRTHALRRLPGCVHVRPQAWPEGRTLARVARLIADESRSALPGASVVMNRLADVLLVEVIRAFLAGRDCASRTLRALADPQIGKALVLVHERPEEPWTVDRLASRVALSRSGFAARFHDLVGEPPLEYVTRWRITRAAELLKDSDAAMAEVAERAGYASEAAFNRAFKRLEGVTPGAYRRRVRARRAA